MNADTGALGRTDSAVAAEPGLPRNHRVNKISTETPQCLQLIDFKCFGLWARFVRYLSVAQLVFRLI